MSVIRGDGTSTVSASTAAYSYVAEISVEESDNVGKPRVGLGSTANENIALRRNHREMELLWKTQKTLVEEEGYVLKLIELYEKSVQLNYTRLTKKVKKIKSHLTEEEIIEMENDLRKKEFADKYRMLIHNQEGAPVENKSSQSLGNDLSVDTSQGRKDASQRLGVIKEESDAASQEVKQDSDPKQADEAKKSLDKTNISKNNKKSFDQAMRSQSCQVNSTRSSSFSNKRRPETTPNTQPPNQDSSEAIDDIIPSLEMLLDQLHNIKSNQFYENQRKLKLYEIRLLEEELKLKKKDLFKAVDQIINWDKKEEVKEEEEKEEEEKPRTRKTSFMRSVIRNFSMELMMKTMQYGWADLGECRYLRNRGGDEEQASSGANTLAKDTMKIRLDQTPADEEEPQDGAKTRDPGFDASGKMIRTADLLGLK